MAAMNENTNIEHNIQVSQKKQKTEVRTSLPGNHGPSTVWLHFEKHYDEETKKYKGTCDCIYCGVKFNAPTKGGTTKLCNHLEKCTSFPGAEEDKKQRILSFGGVSQCSNWKFDQEICRKSLARMIILCELPFSHVEKEGFRLFCADLQPKFHVISRTTVTKDCLLLFHEEINKLKEHLKASSKRVSITTDMWTPIQNLPYMVVTAHFIDEDWKLQKKIINFRVIPHPHNAETIAKALEGCLLEWGVEKVFTITLDNAKNNDSCIVDLRKRMNKRNGLLLGGEFLHIRCFAHVMNRVVRAGLLEVHATIKRLRRSVKYVRSSPSRLQLFKKCADEESITCKRYLCLDVKTRWNSTCLMINAALEFEKVFERLEDQDAYYKKEVDHVVDSDWSKLKSLNTFLEEFYEITKRISGSNYVTSIRYMDELTQVKDLLDAYLNSNDVDFHGMAYLMKQKFEKYCDIDNLNPILVVALVLDPRNKLQYVDWMFRKYVTGEKMEMFVENLRHFMSRLYQPYKIEGNSKCNDSSRNLGTNIMHNVENVAKRTSKREAFVTFLKRKEHVEALNDLDRYLQDDVEEDEANFDVLSWWKGKVKTYHALAIMARDVLSIPITSVASECAFSCAKRVLDPFRNSLTPNTLEALVCTQHWLRSPTLSTCMEEKLEDLEKIESGVINDIGALSMGVRTL